MLMFSTFASGPNTNGEKKTFRPSTFLLTNFNLCLSMNAVIPVLCLHIATFKYGLDSYLICNGEVIITEVKNLRKSGQTART